MDAPVLLRISDRFAVFKIFLEFRDSVSKITYDKKECIMKCYLEKDIESNEYQALEYFQKTSSRACSYPKPYAYDHTIRIVNIEGSDYIVYKTLFYEFIPGTSGTSVTRDFDLTRAKKDLFNHLNDLHSMGFVHGDIKRDNILRKNDGTFVLIDYGSCFNASNNEYPNNTGYHLSFENDWEDLEVACHMMLVDKWKLENN